MALDPRKQLIQGKIFFKFVSIASNSKLENMIKLKRYTLIKVPNRD